MTHSVFIYFFLGQTEGDVPAEAVIGQENILRDVANQVAP